MPQHGKNAKRKVKLGVGVDMVDEEYVEMSIPLPISTW